MNFVCPLSASCQNRISLVRFIEPFRESNLLRFLDEIRDVNQWRRSTDSRCQPNVGGR